jgi:hypothetical protein
MTFFEFIYFIYRINQSKVNMKKNFTITIDPKLHNLVSEKITNKSKYIEWLIYQDLLKNIDLGEIKKLII